MNMIDLQQVAGGVLAEKFNGAFQETMGNMQDVNTSFKVKRKITLEVSFTQNEPRDDCTAEISVKTKLAPVLPIETKFAMGKNLDTGEIEVEEYGKQIKGQLSFNDLPQEEPEVIKGYDPSTGEIYDATPQVDDSKVTDLRTRMVK